MSRTYYVLGREGQPARWSVLNQFTSRKEANRYANDRQRMYGEESAIVVGELDDDAPSRKPPVRRASANTAKANTSSNTASSNTASANTAE